jgi:hypothetical protein
MNLSGINNQAFIRETPGVTGAPGVLGSQPAAELPASAGPGSAASAIISKPAELFNRLRQLKEKDPDTFTEVVSTLTEKLKTAAAQYEADLTGPLLSDLAATFEEVANGGDLAALQSPAAAQLSQRSNLNQLFSGFTAALDQALK